MVLAFIMLAALTATSAVDLPVTEMSTRIGWIQEVKSLLPAVQARDRSAAYRNYANMLVDVGQCDAASNTLKEHEGHDAEVIMTVVDHALHLGDRQCAGDLGRLALSRLPFSTSIEPLRLAELRMAAGAAIRVGGDDALGAVAIADAESALAANTSDLSPNAPMGPQRLWRARASILGTYAGTPFLAPAMTNYGQELAANLARSKTYLPLPEIRGFAMRFAASGRPDLVELVASKLLPPDKADIVDAAGLIRHSEIGESLGNKPRPHCAGGAGAVRSKPNVLGSPDAFETIMNLTIQSGRAAIAARCVALR